MDSASVAKLTVYIARMKEYVRAMLLFEKRKQIMFDLDFIKSFPSFVWTWTGCFKMFSRR